MDFEFFRIAIVLVFLTALLAALLVVRRFSPQLKTQIHKHRRIRVEEAITIAPNTKAVLFNVDGQDYMTILGKSGPSAPLPLLASHQAQEEVTPCG